METLREIDISHILTLKISNEQTNENRTTIKKIFKNNILNKHHPIKIMFEGNYIDVDVIWTTVNEASSVYYTNSQFIDVIVQEHARLVITGIGNQIKATKPQFGNWEVEFMVTCPVKRLVPIANIIELNPHPPVLVVEKKDDDFPVSWDTMMK